jgi:putative intracellular protease/amidase
MPDTSLAGKKIAVLVEAQYIPAEIRCYQERFASYGADVHLMSYLWGQLKQTFVSEVEVPNKTPETLEVSIDFTKVKLDDYAAVIMAANYTSVRLRWNEAAATGANAADAARHALWLLTPSADYLAGRRVTCNPVVLSDVLNAGAFYVPAPAGTPWFQHVVVDNDLITNMSAVHEQDGKIVPIGTERLVDAIRDRIVALAAEPERPAPAPAPAAC